MEEKYNNYLKIIQDAKSYNNHLFVERKLRLPFIDTQTGVAQVDCSLWRSKEERDNNNNDCRRYGSINGALYSYPAVRWQKRRREYLMKINSVAAAATLSSSESPSFRVSSSSSSTTNNCPSNGSTIQQQQHTYNQSQQCQNASCSTTSISKANCQLAASNPTRADSTGSHSCMTVDSDSRDLSFATSQSFDSPRHQLEEEHSSLCYELLFPKDSCSEIEHNNCSFRSNQDLQVNRGDPSTKAITKDRNHIPTDHDEQQRQQQQQSLKQKRLEDQTKAAIRLHSKMSKRKNVGQSLMRSNSILVKDGQNPTNGTKRFSANSDDVIDVTKQLGITEQHPSSPSPTDNKSSELEPLVQATICNGSRPYACSICDHTYKTRPGLSYHFIHTHNTTLPKNLPIKNKDDKKIASKFRVNSSSAKGRLVAFSGEQSILVKDVVRTLRNGRTTRAQQRTNLDSQREIVESDTHFNPIGINQVESNCNEHVSTMNHELNGRESNCFEQLVKIENDNNGTHNNEQLKESGFHRLEGDQEEDPQNSITINGTAKLENTYGDLNGQEGNNIKKSHLKQNPFCDFCLGTVDKNRRTRLPEELVSCFSCGSSGHPSCLRFSDNIRTSVRKYNWQCIECKTCSTCNNADNEDQLLFCDDCDRSYHTYCLSPPLVDLPEGNWSCKSCIVEYHESNK